MSFRKWQKLNAPSTVNAVVSVSSRTSAAVFMPGFHHTLTRGATQVAVDFCGDMRRQLSRREYTALDRGIALRVRKTEPCRGSTVESPAASYKCFGCTPLETSSKPALLRPPTSWRPARWNLSARSFVQSVDGHELAVQTSKPFIRFSRRP